MMNRKGRPSRGREGPGEPSASSSSDLRAWELSKRAVAVRVRPLSRDLGIVVTAATLYRNRTLLLRFHDLASTAPATPVRAGEGDRARRDPGGRRRLRRHRTGAAFVRRAAGASWGRVAAAAGSRGAHASPAAWRAARRRAAAPRGAARSGVAAAAPDAARAGATPAARDAA